MAEEFRKLAKNPPLDEYGMMPYLDEIVGSYFVMDLIGDLPLILMVGLCGILENL
ncbi:hypothetical protein VBZ67_11565 [Campylobacter concisus]